MAKRANKNKEEDVIKDIFNKKCYELFTDYQVKQYLCDKYFFTEQTAQKYLEKYNHKFQDENKYDYSKALGTMHEFLTSEIQLIKDDKYLKLAYIKELNKINNLGNKKEIDITSGGQPINYMVNFKAEEETNQSEDVDNETEDNKD